MAGEMDGFMDVLMANLGKMTGQSSVGTQAKAVKDWMLAAVAAADIDNDEMRDLCLEHAREIAKIKSTDNTGGE